MWSFHTHMDMLLTQLDTDLGKERSVLIFKHLQCSSDHDPKKCSRSNRRMQGREQFALRDGTLMGMLHLAEEM